MNYLLASVRAAGKLAAACAATGLAASNYNNGQTAHSLFKVQVQEPDDEAPVGIGRKSPVATTTLPANPFNFSYASSINSRSSSNDICCKKWNLSGNLSSKHASSIIIACDRRQLCNLA
jgi:hypothetical protein